MSLDLSNLSSNNPNYSEDDSISVDGAMCFMPAYVGFSAQSFSIPSIACESDFKQIEKLPNIPPR